MTTETMNVHKALSELKVIDSRIVNLISSATFCNTKKNNSAKIAGETVEDYEKDIRGSYDKITNLIERRKAIKKAVTLSNAVTKVTINGEEYTVAEAIEMKNHGMENDKILLKFMSVQYTKALKLYETANGDELQAKAQAYVTGLFGTKENAVKGEVIDQTMKTFIDANGVTMIDPLDLKAKVEALQDKIDSFTSEVDSILSTSNAMTSIEIIY